MQPWHPVAPVKFVLFSLAAAALSAGIAAPGCGWIWLLDSANLLFHEAGHMFFGLLGPAMGLYGGTLGQFVFPLVLVINFWRQRLAVSYSAGWLWFFENFFSVARYMADARAQELPLVGGGGHDWFNIFLRWHCLDHDVAIAAAVRVCGWAGIGLTWAWLAWLTFRKDNRNRLRKDGSIPSSVPG